MLRILGRVHGVAEIRAAWRDARAAGFPTIGLDLIFGIPGQTAASFAADLERTVALKPSHVSAYALAPEPGTPLHAAVGRGELRMPTDDDVADMYEEARRTLAAAGLRQYEISNFSRPGAECRHNLKYWRREGYHGFGPSAHGLLFPPGKAPLGLRTANPRSLADYARRIREGRLPWTETRVCRRADAWKESLIFGLREIDGVDTAEIENRIGAPPHLTRGAVEELVTSGRLSREGSRLRLPDALLFVSNEVLQRLA
jgi:oxygen-independent coproporphyrinogen-3 oxidase